MAKKTFSTLILGDVYGEPGYRALFVKLQSLIKKTNADFVIINGENSYKGFGIIPSQVDTLFGMGIDVITSGNHIWQQEEILPYLDSQSNLLRPANYGSSVPGHGYTVVQKGSEKVCVINLQGRINLFPIDDPFRTVSDVLKKPELKDAIVFVDFHGESCEEKEALAMYLDGKVTAVVGTHIHVPTDDLKILPKGTAYVTDLGMCGSCDGIIGSDPEVAIKRQMTQLPLKAQVYDGNVALNGVVVISDCETAKAVEIKRIDC
ncbi:MAG: TIGR00282 family metallophosphoesterase [Sphaerochaetaceae bacterium]|nr:TIGR00282 family metallophosphoesterase [Sphaerochaetaceae bacterium]